MTYLVTIAAAPALPGGAMTPTASILGEVSTKWHGSGVRLLLGKG